MAFRPYLFFAGTCAEAFTRYQEIFGGELTVIRLSEAPGGEVPPDGTDYVIHAAIAEGDLLLMGSDDPVTEDFRAQGMMVSYDAADADDAARVMDALADGGEVTQALVPTFFSEAFGMCTDRFGTPWMVVAPEPAG